MAKFLGETIRLELEMPTKQSRQKRHDRVVRREDVGSYDVKTDEDGLAVVEPERFVKRSVLEEQVEDEKHEENVQFRNDNVLGNVVQLPMAQFVAKHG